MKKITLNKRQPKRKLFAIVDDEDFEKLSKYNWTILKGHTNILYAIHKPRFRPFIYMHRFILNAPKGSIVDHKNHNGLDNRKKNIRLCSYSENAINSREYKHNTSGHKGVVWDKERKKWASQIMIKQKTIHLGRFSNLQNAIKARREAEKTYFFNFI